MKFKQNMSECQAIDWKKEESPHKKYCSKPITTILAPEVPTKVEEEEDSRARRLKISYGKVAEAGKCPARELSLLLRVDPATQDVPTDTMYNPWSMGNVQLKHWTTHICS